MKKIEQQMAVLRKKTTADLGKERDNLHQQLVKIRIAVSLQKEKNVSQIRRLRKSIARLETILHEKGPNA